MDYNPTTIPTEEQLNYKSSFDKFLDEQEERERNQKKTEDELLDSDKKGNNKESALSFKRRIDRVAKKAVKKLRDSEPNANAHDEESVAKLVGYVAESKNLSEEEKNIIRLKRRSIADRTSQLLAEESGSVNKQEEVLTLSPDEALSLAVSENIAEDNASGLVQINNGISNGQDGGSEKSLIVENRVAEVTDLIVPQNLFEFLDSEPATDDGINSKSAKALKLARIIKIKELVGSKISKPGDAANSGILAGAPSFHHLGNGDKKSVETTSPESEPKPRAELRKDFEFISAYALFNQIKNSFRKLGMDKRRLEVDDIGNELRVAAPLAKTSKFGIDRDIKLYSTQESKYIVSTPKDLKRGWASEQRSGHEYGRALEGDSVRTNQNRSDIGSEVVYDREVEQFVALRGKRQTVLATIYDRASRVSETSVMPDPARLESNFSVNSFERYLEVVVSRSRAVDSKQLKKIVSKKLGRQLTLFEQKNVDNFWLKREARLSSVNPNAYKPIVDSKEASTIGGNNDSSSVAIEADPHRRDKPFTDVHPKANARNRYTKNTMLDYNSSGMNITIVILAIAVLVSAITYAIIIMI
ncbi:MAG TPA: hypothetical protein PKA29_00960 [Candidatus Saccharibacteria bacterium]|nr:hypothetical protein [Candidatus Saccharibacteria bacterium]